MCRGIKFAYAAFVGARTRDTTISFRVYEAQVAGRDYYIVYMFDERKNFKKKIIISKYSCFAPSLLSGVPLLGSVFFFFLNFCISVISVIYSSVLDIGEFIRPGSLGTVTTLCDTRATPANYSVRRSDSVT